MVGFFDEGDFFRAEQLAFLLKVVGHGTPLALLRLDRERRNADPPSKDTLHFYTLGRLVVCSVMTSGHLPERRLGRQAWARC